MANKVTHIINCAGRQVPNHWEPIGVKYITYLWLDHDCQVVVDTKGRTDKECYEFIMSAVERGDSVLIHSAKGQSRACTVAALWMMRRYRWTAGKALEFLRSRKPELDIRPAFLRQLAAHDARLQGVGPKTSMWNEISEEGNIFENEELLLRNTYLNAQVGPFADLVVATHNNRSPKLKWADDAGKGVLLAIVITENNSNYSTAKESLEPIMKKDCKKNSNSKPQHLVPTTAADLLLKNEDVKKPLAKDMEALSREALIRQNHLEMEKLLSHMPGLHTAPGSWKLRRPSPARTSEVAVHRPWQSRAGKKGKLRKHVDCGEVEGERSGKLGAVRRCVQSARPSSAVVRRDATPVKVSSKYWLCNNSSRYKRHKDRPKQLRNNGEGVDFPEKILRGASSAGTHNSVVDKKLPAVSLKPLTKQHSSALLKESPSRFSQNARSVRRLEPAVCDEGRAAKQKKGKYARPMSPGIHGKVAEPLYKSLMKNHSASKINFKRNQKQRAFYKSYNIQ